MNATVDRKEHDIFLVCRERSRSAPHARMAERVPVRVDIISDGYYSVLCFMTASPHSHIYYVFQSFALINYFRYHIGWYSLQRHTPVHALIFSCLTRCRSLHPFCFSLFSILVPFILSFSFIRFTSFLPIV